MIIVKIAIGLPAYNEEKNIASIISKLEKSSDLILVCDDGSFDLTGKIASKMGAIVITHEKNKGYGAAIRSLDDLKMYYNGYKMLKKDTA